MTRRTALAAALALALPRLSFADSCLSLDGLVRMSHCELEELYRSAPAGQVAAGYAAGKAIKSPGTRKAVRFSRLAGLVWQGKYFHACDSTITNRIFGRPMIQADVAHGESWFDGGPSIIMDYACRGPKWTKSTRDEMREVAPGLFLGMMYQRTECGPKFVMFFALQGCPVGPVQETICESTP